MNLDHKDSMDEHIEKEIGHATQVDDNGRLNDDAVTTRRVLWKIDIHVLPILALLFLCSFLDRTNVGNAKLFGLNKDLHMTDMQYDIGLSVFYATYIASEIPSNLVLKKFSPRIWLPFLTFIWGIITMCLGFVQNFSGFTVIRALLGLAEGGLLPGIVLYLSTLYKREEMALRIGLFYTTASLSGAFGGLLARGIATIGHAGGLSPWRWIFVIEGLLTAIVGLVTYFFLPNGLSTASFLTPAEREFAENRLIRSVGQGPEGQTLNDQFEWSEVRRGVFSIQTWLSASAYFGILAGLYSFGLFLPTIIKELGYTANQAQLWSVIPYAVAAIVTVFIAFLSDRLRLRGGIMLGTLPLAIIGYAVIGNVKSESVRYGMTFLMATGLYASVPPVLGWISNNSAGHYKRATCTGLQLAIANCGGFVAVFIYPSKEGPEYHQGHSIILGLLCMGWLMYV